MSNFLKIKIGNERISILTDDGLLLEDSSSLVVLDENEQIIEVGETPESMQEDTSSDWEKVKSNASFCNPFSITDFRPKVAARAMSYLVYTALLLFDKSQNKALSSADYSIEWQINFVGYDNLEKKLQDLFEYYIYEDFSYVKPKSLLINGQSKDTAKYQWSVKFVKFGYLITIFTLSYLVFQIAQFTGSDVENPSSLLDIIGILFLFILVSYISYVIYTAISKIILKNLIPYPVYKAMIGDSQFDLPKQIIKILRQITTSKRRKK